MLQYKLESKPPNNHPEQYGRITAITVRTLMEGRFEMRTNRKAYVNTHTHSHTYTEETENFSKTGTHTGGIKPVLAALYEKAFSQINDKHILSAGTTGHRG